MKRLFVVLCLTMMIGTSFGATCPNNMSESSIFSGTFSSVSPEMTCGSGFQLFELPESMVVYTSGHVMANPEPLCPMDQHWENGECVPYVRGICDNGFSQVAVDNSTFYKLDVNNQCTSGYQRADIPTNVVYGIVNGILLGTGVTLCGDGYRMVGDTCTPYNTGDCPNGMFAYEPGADTFSAIVNGACASGYELGIDNKSCGDSTVADGKCAVLCDAGENWTYGGVCSARCTTNGIRILHAGDVAFQTYANKTTEHALVFDNGVGRCYGNMTTGRASGTLNVDVRGTTWHVTE
ncbi:MAG: hypothetical protein MJ170_01510 [Alphaproteobacteria bacterium]|nr:hypothetical protein [Alphaproteobacteria bacterium]